MILCLEIYNKIFEYCRHYDQLNIMTNMQIIK